MPLGRIVRSAKHSFSTLDNPHLGYIPAAGIFAGAAFVHGRAFGQQAPDRLKNTALNAGRIRGACAILEPAEVAAHVIPCLRLRQIQPESFKRRGQFRLADVALGKAGAEDEFADVLLHLPVPGTIGFQNQVPQPLHRVILRVEIGGFHWDVRIAPQLPVGEPRYVSYLAEAITAPAVFLLGRLRLLGQGNLPGMPVFCFCLYFRCDRSLGAVAIS